MASALELYGRHVERGEETGGRDVGGTVAVDGVMTCRKLYLVASRKHCGRVVRIGKIGQSEMVDLLPRFAHSLDEFVCGADVFEGFAVTVGRYAQLSGFLFGHLEMNRFVVVHPEVSEEDPVCVVLDFGGTSRVACGGIGDRFGGVRTGCEQKQTERKTPQGESSLFHSRMFSGFRKQFKSEIRIMQEV